MAPIDPGLAPLAGLGEVVLDRDMGGHFAVPQLLDKVCNVKTLVPSQRDPPLASSTLHGAMLIDQIKAGSAFRRAAGLRNTAPNHQTMAVLHQRMAHVIPNCDEQDSSQFVVRSIATQAFLAVARARRRACQPAMSFTQCRLV